MSNQAAIPTTPATGRPVTLAALLGAEVCPAPPAPDEVAEPPALVALLTRELTDSDADETALLTLEAAEETASDAEETAEEVAEAIEEPAEEVADAIEEPTEEVPDAMAEPADEVREPAAEEAEEAPEVRVEKPFSAELRMLRAPVEMAPASEEGLAEAAKFAQ